MIYGKHLKVRNQTDKQEIKQGQQEGKTGRRKDKMRKEQGEK
jgi:hypothetical protein